MFPLETASPNEAFPHQTILIHILNNRSRMSTVAALIAPWVGFFAGLVAWFVVTHLRSGIINVTTTGDATNAVAGNITSWGTGFLMAIVLSYLFPAKWEPTGEVAVQRANKINGVLIGQSPGHTPGGSSPLRTENINASSEQQTVVDEEKGVAKSDAEPPSDPRPDTIVRTGNELVDFLETSHIQPMSAEEVRKATRLAVGFNVVFFVIAIVLVPFTLFGSSWVFTKAGFTGWCVVSFLWVWCSMIICVIWPVVESRKTIARIFGTLVFGRGRKGSEGVAVKE